MKKAILTYGIIAGLIVSLMLVLSFSGDAMDFAYGELIGYATMIIAFSTIFIAVKNQRDRFGDGTITFRNALRTGLGITLVATTLYIVSWMIISETIAKDFMANYYQQSVEKLKASNISEDELQARIEEMKAFQEMYKNPIVKIGMTFLEIFPVGLLVSLVAAIILKRKNTEQ
jgi:hypothetical protein